MSGFFITFEGVEGSGKSTQAARLLPVLRDGGSAALLTKEPGGTAIGDRIRAILLDPDSVGMDGLTELFLYAASRRQHVVEKIRPALDGGTVVVCDRYTDATLAYQGFGRTLDLEMLRQINHWATDGLTPDLTLIFDLPEEVGLTRARARNTAQNLQAEGRFEAEDLRFHRRIREGYLALEKSEPGRFAVVDADGTPDEVFRRMLETLAKRAPRLPLAAIPS